MTYYRDLSPCDYFDHGIKGPHRLLAVGWLEVGDIVPTGTVSSRVRARLQDFVRNIWSPIHLLGGYSCSLCLGKVAKHDVPGAPSSFANLFIPGDGCVFASPELIVHYVDEHGYSPPPEFLAAVESCPPLWSTRYFAALAEHASGRLARCLPPSIFTEKNGHVHPAIIELGAPPRWRAPLTWVSDRRLLRRIRPRLEWAQGAIGTGPLRATTIARLGKNVTIVTVQASQPIRDTPDELESKLRDALHQAGLDVEVDLRMPDE